MRDFQTSGRSTVHGRHAMIATAHPQAGQAGIDMLRAGGTAADAAIAAAAVLAVVEPMSTGIGGDAFCLAAGRGEAGVAGYNGSGAAPLALSPDKLGPVAGDRIALHSVHAVTVPGAVDLWLSLHERYGRLPMRDVLRPAITYARDGFVVSPRIAFDWGQMADQLAKDANAARHVLIDGRAPRTGQIMRAPALADTLSAIAEQGRAGFYQGPVARDMIASLNALGGLHSADDFAAHRGEWVTPISTNYRGIDVYEIPPNGQGVTTLLMLNILENFDPPADGPSSAQRLHLQAEATRLAFAERDAVLADPRHADVPLDRLLDKTFAAELARSIDRNRAGAARPAVSSRRDTTYLAVADKDGLIISFINSLYHRFGSCLASRDSGVVFQNRGAGFSLQPGHPNLLKGGKRPFHTIIPAMALKDGMPWMAFGVMGGDYQPVGQTHVLTNMVDYGMDAQAAIDEPRSFLEAGALQAERGISAEVRDKLAAMGHRVIDAPYAFGGGQIVAIDRTFGTYIGASERRRDGCALAL